MGRLRLGFIGAGFLARFQAVALKHGLSAWSKGFRCGFTPESHVFSLVLIKYIINTESCGYLQSFVPDNMVSKA